MLADMGTSDETRTGAVLQHLRELLPDRLSPERRNGAVLVRVQSLEMSLARMDDEVLHSPVLRYGLDEAGQIWVGIPVVYTDSALDSYGGLPKHLVDGGSEGC